MNNIKKLRWLLALAPLLCLMQSACTEVDNTYCRFPCRFVFNMQRHGISLALNTMVSTPGVFCDVSHVMHKGVSYYRFQTNHGQCDSVIFTQEDVLSTVLIGVHNGLIIGYGTFDTPYKLYAYDAQCRNCFDPDAVPVKDYHLRIDAAGMAHCQACGRSYNLNTGGNVVSGTTGKNLWRYHQATCNATVVSVVN